MSSPGLTCEVYVDGNRLADTAADYRASTPTVLEGLAVTWGRRTVVDQPDVSTCVLTVADSGGSAGDFLHLLHVGHVLDVWAAGPVSGGTAPVDVTVDGSFETATPATRVKPVAATVTADTTFPAADGRAIRVTPAAGGGTVHIPPGPFSTSATAWNPIPHAAPGASWTVKLQVALGTGCTGTLAVGLYSSPASAAAAPIGAATVIPAPPGPTPAYVTVTAAMVIPAGGPYWVGAVLTTANTRRWVDAAGSWAAQPATLTWQQIGASWIDDLHVLAPAGTITRTMVFSGRITDLAAVAAGSGGVSVDVTAADRLADLGNDVIGDNPWLAQPISARVKRIAALAATPFTVDVAAGPGARQVSWVDIDSQDVAALLADLATSADAVLWPVFAANRGFYLWMEDTAQRQAFSVLAVDGGSGLVVIVGNPRPAAAVPLSACLIGADVSWEQDVSDVLSIVDVTWLAQTLDEGGAPAPTEVHQVTVDGPAVSEYGQRRLGYSTQLTSAGDATQIGDRLMSRSRAVGWRASGMSWDTRLPVPFGDRDRAAAMAILDGAKRVGLPLVLTDMPGWSPAGAADVPTYLEGGTFGYSGGRWQLDMTVSPAGLTGGSLAWRDVNGAYRWRDFDPGVRWVDLYGVGKG